MESERKSEDYVRVKVGVLRELREIRHRRTGKTTIHLDPTWVAFDLKTEEDAIAAALDELLLLEFIRPTGDSDFFALQGQCEITQEGMKYLNSFETAETLESTWWN